MRKKILFCEKHQVERIAIGKKQYMRCKQCFNESRKKWKDINKVIYKENNKLYNAETRERRQEWVKQDRINNNEKYVEYAKKGFLKNASMIALRKCLRKYGLTEFKYRQMIMDCDNRCSICRKSETRKLGRDDKLTKLSVDHCHETGKVRGLLCFACNLGLGKFKDDINLLQEAIEYLNRASQIG